MAKIIGEEGLEIALRLIEKENALDAAKGIVVAEGIERESIAFYARQAEKFRGLETEKFFLFLEGQEKGHLRALVSLRESLERQGKWTEPRLPAKEKPKIFAKKDWDKKNKEGLAAVLFALWKEKQAQEFYERIAGRLENKGAKEFFVALAEFEKGHAKMLEELVDESYYSKELIMG